MDKWLESCPKPIVSRVIDDKNDLLHIATTRCMYAENLLVVTDLDALNNLCRGKENSVWSVYTFHIQYPTKYEYYQTKQLDENTAYRMVKLAHKQATTLTLINIQPIRGNNVKVLTVADIVG
jgi:hypothetical protein